MENIEKIIENPCIKCNSLRRLVCFKKCEIYNHYLFIKDLELSEYRELDIKPQWEGAPGEASLNNYDEDYK